MTLHPGGGLKKRDVVELVTESYRLIVQNLPAAARPVDPITFGQHDG